MMSAAVAGDWSMPWFHRGAGGFSRARMNAARFPRASRVAIGDLGCTGVDVDAFKRTCRAPLNPGGWNRWLLWRTTRDEASALDVERSTYAVFGKWFELVEGSDKVSLPGNGTGKVDNLSIRIVPWDWSAPWRPIARREDCTPLPTIAGTGAIGVMVEFVFRGTSRDMPWPVHKAQMIGPWCPVDADWILARAYEPPADAAPRERTAREELSEGVSKVASALLPSPVSFAIAAFAVLGVWTIGHAFRR